MKIKLYLSNSSYSGCTRIEEFDTVKDLGREAGEWENLSEEDRLEVVENEMSQYIEMWYTEETI